MSRTFAVMATGLVLVSSVAASTAADAQRFRSHSRNVQGIYGRGYHASGSSVRGGAAGSSTHSVQTNDGRGVTTTHSYSASDGSYTGGVTHTANNGTTWGSTTATADGNGNRSSSTTATGPRGATATVSRSPSTTSQQ